MGLDPNRHPCFNADARAKTGRIHLPIAPSCNIQCNYCDRKFDCMNESRPGVTSKLLTPRKPSSIWPTRSSAHLHWRLRESRDRATPSHQPTKHS